MPQPIARSSAAQRPREAGFFRWILDVILQRAKAPMKDYRPFAESIALINRIGEMEPGFNGHHAAVATLTVRQDAIRFLSRLASSYGTSVPEPSMVAPTSDGGVALEWRLQWPSEVIEIVFLPNGAHEYTQHAVANDKLSQVQVYEDAHEDDLVRLAKLSLVGRHTA